MHSSMNVENACIKMFLVNIGVMIKDYIGAPDQPFKYTMADGWMDGRGRKHKGLYQKEGHAMRGCKK